MVQGLGGFIAVMKPARFIADEGLFYPPYRTVTFNQHLKEGDGLLTQLYMQTYDATYPQAVLQVEKDVNELLKELDLQGEVCIGNIGLLQKNLENRINLKASPSGIDSPALYGFSSITSSFWMKEEEEKANVPVAKEPEKEGKEGKHTYRIPFMYDMSVAAAIAAIFFLFFASPMMDSHRDESDICIAGQGEIIKKAIAPANEETAKPAAEETAIVEEPVKAESYVIVLASYVSEKNATSFVEKLKKAGFEDTRYEGGKIPRILYGEYASEAEAISSLRNMRDKHTAFDNGWVMQVK